MTPWARRGSQVLQTIFRPLLTASQKADVRKRQEVNERPVEYAFVFTRMAGRGTGHLLDVGTGKSAFPALATLAGWRVTAVDNILDFWRRGALGVRWGLFNEHFAVEDRDITKQQMPPDFDVVECISTFEHVRDRPGLFAAMSRALKPSGELLITTPYCEAGGVPNVYVRPNSDAYGRTVPYICRVLDRQELDDLCQQNSMKVDVIKYWRFWRGQYWSEGQQLEKGERSTSALPHDLACISIVRDTTPA